MTARRRLANDGYHDSLLSAADISVRARIRAIVDDVIRPAAEQVDRDSTFPSYGFGALARAGLAGLLIPPAYGGSGHSLLAYVAAMEEIAAGCCATSTVYMTQMHAVHPIATVGTDDQARRIVPSVASGERYAAIAITEPDAGSDAAALRTVAERRGDTYVINGSKSFISNGDRAEVILVFATLAPGSKARGITAFIVERPAEGLTAGKVLHKLGQRGASTCDVFFDNVQVHESNRLGEEGDGFKILLEAVATSRLSAAAQGIGLAREAYERAVGYFTSRGMLGGRRPELQAVEFSLADLRMAIASARLLLYSVAATVDRTASRTGQVSMVKVVCTDLAVRVANEAVRLLGSDGDRQDLGLERILRDSKILQIYDGTNQIQRVLISRDTCALAQEAGA